MLTQDERQLYARQMLLPGWGEEAQERLKRSTAFIAGAGGLGSPTAIYLAVAGVGELRICDFDTIELSNLNRQVLHSPSRIGQRKALSAQQTLEQINPQIRITPITDRLTPDNAECLMRGAHIILDCMDNFDTRYLLNDLAIRLGIPMVFAAVWGMEGRLSVLAPPDTPCLRCLYPEGPPREVFPVVGATPGAIGTLQAVETIKHLTGLGAPLRNRLLLWDGLTMTFRTFRIRKDPRCLACARHG